MSKNPLEALPGGLGNHLGEYLREQREQAKLSVRQLSALAGISNPYLSQIERGVRRPSADILQQIAKGLSISAETLYVQAGLLDPKDAAAEAGATTRAAIRNDPALTARQRQSLLEIYESFVGAADAEGAEPTRPTPRSRATQRAAKQAKGGALAKKASTATKTAGTKPAAAAKKAPARKTAGTKSAATAKKAPAKKANTATKTAGTKPAAKQTSGARKGTGATTPSTQQDDTRS